MPPEPDDRNFTVPEARALLADLRDDIDEFVRLRGHLTVAQNERQGGDETVSLADLKAMDARLSELVDGITTRGVQVKGLAPLLLDFPMQSGGRTVLLCWVEGELELGWWHDADHGFAGRQPLGELHDDS